MEKGVGSLTHEVQLAKCISPHPATYVWASELVQAYVHAMAMMTD